MKPDERPHITSYPIKNDSNLIIFPNAQKNSKVQPLVLSGDIMHIRKQTEPDTLHTVDVLQFKTPVTAFCFDLP